MKGGGKGRKSREKGSGIAIFGGLAGPLKTE